MTTTENDKWITKHKNDIEKAFNQLIDNDRLQFFCIYDGLEDMHEDFYDWADESKVWVNKVLDKWVIQLA